MRAGTSNKLGLILFSILIIIIALHWGGVLSPLETASLKALSPVGTALYNFKQKINSFWSRGVPMSDFLALEAERNALVVEEAKLKVVEEENKNLREALGFISKSQQKLLAAEIIGRDPVFPNHYILNRGARDGVGEGFAIVSPGGILVGKIIKVEEKISTMLIPVDNNFQTAAAVLGKSKNAAAGLIKGEKGLGIKMELIPQGEAIDKDDIIVTSGLELNMPKGLVIGRVAEVTRADKVIFGTATITPLVSYKNLSFVMIVLPQY